MLDISIIERLKDGHLCAQYFMASYCYYILDLSPMTDSAFDRLCQRLLERWDFIDPTIYPHRNLTDKESLAAGTCMMLDHDYPTIVRSSADHYNRMCTSGQMARDLEPHLLPPARNRITRIARTAPIAATAPTRPLRVTRTPVKGPP